MIIHLLAPQNRSNWDFIWHQCYKTIECLPYEKKVWDDDQINDLLEQDDEEFYNKYLDKLPKIYKLDYVRYLILEIFGGVYIDLDIEIIHDFIKYLKQDKIYMMEGDIGELYSNCLMVSPNTPPFKELWYVLKLWAKQRIIANFDMCKDKYMVMYLIGPFALSEWFSKYYKNFNLPKVQTLSKHHFSDINSDIQFAIHHATNTWKNGIQNK